MACCSYLQNILKNELYFTNGIDCILDKKLFFMTIFKAALLQSWFNKLFSVGIFYIETKKIYDIRISEFDNKL